MTSQPTHRCYKPHLLPLIGTIFVGIVLILLMVPSQCSYEMIQGTVGLLHEGDLCDCKKEYPADYIHYGWPWPYMKRVCSWSEVGSRVATSSNFIFSNSNPRTDPYRPPWMDVRGWPFFGKGDWGILYSALVYDLLLFVSVLLLAAVVLEWRWRKRRLTFSLREGLLLFLSAAVLGSYWNWLGITYHAEQAALKRMNNILTVFDTSFNEADMLLRRLFGDAVMSRGNRVCRLSLDLSMQEGNPSECVALLKEFHSLREIQLNQSLPGEWLNDIPARDRIRKITLDETGESDLLPITKLEHLAKLNNLETLIIDHLHLDPAAFLSLFPLHKLKCIQIRSSPLQRSHLEDLAKMPHLQHLTIDKDSLPRHCKDLLKKLPFIDNDEGEADDENNAHENENELTDGPGNLEN